MMIRQVPQSSSYQKVINRYVIYAKHTLMKLLEQDRHHVEAKLEAILLMNQRESGTPYSKKADRNWHVERADSKPRRKY